jgi:hypothetical protein
VDTSYTGVEVIYCSSKSFEMKDILVDDSPEVRNEIIDHHGDLLDGRVDQYSACIHTHH